MNEMSEMFFHCVIQIIPAGSWKKMLNGSYRQ